MIAARQQNRHAWRASARSLRSMRNSGLAASVRSLGDAWLRADEGLDNLDRAAVAAKQSRRAVADKSADPVGPALVF